MGPVSSKGIEFIAYQAYPYLTTANLNLNHQDLNLRGYDAIYEILLQNELLPKLIPRTKKSNEASEQHRMEANRVLLSSKASESVLMIYTKAICVAEPGSKEIALAYACRADVTFGLGEYHDSIKDFGRALAGNYPGRKSKIYEARGKCHMAVFQYSQAIEDFEQAKSHNQNELMSAEPDKNFTQTIDGLIRTCQTKNRQCQKRQPQLPPTDPIKLSHPASPYIKFASTALDIKFSPEFGRHVVASVDIKPGDVLTIEKPFVSVLRPSQNGNFFCDYCKMKSYSTIPCMSCTTVVFCSEECRESSWNAYHSIECGILSTLIMLSRSDSIEGGYQMKLFMALRILILVSKCGKEIDERMTEALNHKSVQPESAFVDGKYLSDDYTAIRHLLTNVEYRSEKKLIDFAVCAICLVHLLKEGTEFFKDSDSAVLSGEAVARSCFIEFLSQKNLAAANMLFKNLMMVHINGQEISETTWSKGQFPSGQTIAVGTFGLHGLFNHSCDPNVTHFSLKGDSLFTVAIQPIKRGQQIFEDYGYNYNAESYSERQTELQKHFNFTCKCIACLNKWPPYPCLPERPVLKQPKANSVIMNHANRFVGIRNKIFQGNGTDDHLEFLIQFMTLAQENVELPWKHYVDCQDTIKLYMNLKAHPELRQKTRR